MSEFGNNGWLSGIKDTLATGVDLFFEVDRYNEAKKQSKREFELERQRLAVAEAEQKRLLSLNSYAITSDLINSETTLTLIKWASIFSAIGLVAYIGTNLWKKRRK